ncbi:MAG: bifunctional metallophosphatase/5'-nucleotidase [Bacteroidota bacterium]
MKNALLGTMLLLALPGHYLFSQEKKDTLCILQLNDVYEIGALDQGRVGGMARVATLVKQHEARYQTLVVVAGDFVSPSVIGTTKVDGQRVSGKHIVELMNQAGVDLVTFGNHEFDISEKDLQHRINESRFQWLSSDVQHVGSTGVATPFYKTAPDSTAVPPYFLLTSTNNQFTVGIVTATIASNRQPWVRYQDRLPMMKSAWKQIRRKSDLVIGLTHLNVADDLILLRKMKRLPLIMGGHDHENMFATNSRGAVAKADANAKTMYRHLIFRSGRKGKVQVVSTLLAVDTTVLPDPGTAEKIKDWESKAYASFRAIGLEPSAVVYNTPEPLDGKEASVRQKQTNLGVLVASAMLAASPSADAAVFNSGSIRVDDMIQGVVTQLDIIRTLPFGGKICEVEMSGTLFQKMLLTAERLKGTGAYLQRSSNISVVEGKPLLNNLPIDTGRTYTIISAEFLFSGVEKGLEFLKEGTEGIKSIKRFDAPGDIHTDVRLAVVTYLAGLQAKMAGHSQ